MAGKKCTLCGDTINKYDGVCEGCGMVYEEKPKQEPKFNSYRQTHQKNNFRNSQYAHNYNTYIPRKRGPYNKWISIILCLVLGIFGIHKFYEGKYLLGILYILTGGLFGFGIVYDLIVLLFRNVNYYL